MAKNLLPSDPALLSALLEGLQMSRQRLDAQIASVRAAIAGEPEPEVAAPAAAAAVAAPRKGKKGRKPGRPKGSTNKKKDVAASAAAPAASVKEKAPRRKLSASARKAIAAAQKRRWEEFRKNNPK